MKKTLKNFKKLKKCTFEKKIMNNKMVIWFAKKS